MPAKQTRIVHVSSAVAESPRERLKLAIVIPALNEEDSIENIITRSLDARRQIIANSSVTEVDITVVSDGSTDRTVEIASRYLDRINLVVFEKNRGYGAAIKFAWNQSDADLLGFLDADGTCDPSFFAELCEALRTEQGDVALGSRLNAQSKMPLVRRTGNILFASLLTLFASRTVRDTASGMRVVRRTALPRLLPLPDGLHFTPAMSARALVSGEVRIVEVPMPYNEREGESKLRLAKDGVRFLKSILDAAFLYRPSRPLGLLGLLCLGIASALMALPAWYYLQHRLVLEWMIYRFIVGQLLGMAGFLFLCVGYLSRRVVELTVSSDSTPGFRDVIVANFYSSAHFWLAPLLLVFIGGLLVVPSFFELVRTGGTYEHWSRFIAMAFLFQIAVILIITRVLVYSLDLIATELAYRKRGTLY